MLPLRPLPVPVAWVPLSVSVEPAEWRSSLDAADAGAWLERALCPLPSASVSDPACVIVSNTCSWPLWPSASGTCRGGRSACRVGRWGSSFYALDAKRRRVTLDNLARAFPGRPAADRRRIARGVFRHFGRMLFELLKFSELAPDEMLARVEFEGEEHARQAYAAGRGVFFLTAHFGCWETHGLVHGLQSRADGRHGAAARQPAAARPAGAGAAVHRQLRHLPEGRHPPDAARD